MPTHSFVCLSWCALLWGRLNQKQPTMQSPLPQSLDNQIPGHDGQFTVFLSVVTTQGFARRFRIPQICEIHTSTSTGLQSPNSCIVFSSVIASSPNGNNFRADIASSSTIIPLGANFVSDLPSHAFEVSRFKWNQQADAKVLSRFSFSPTAPLALYSL